MSFKNNAKRNGDIISPCNKPTSHEKRSDNELKHLTLSLMLLYIDLITSNIFPSIPALIILYHRLARDTESNAFLRSMNAQYKQQDKSYQKYSKQS